MESRALGSSNIQASAIAIGTWAIGGWMWGGTDEEEAIRAIRISMDNGVTLIDTAPAYGFGLSEQIVGEAIQGKRDKVVLATKCGLVWHTGKGQAFLSAEGRQIHRYLGRDSIRYEIEQSLVRLKTDYIDLYQTHWQDPTTPIEETMTALLELKSEGKIRAIGVCNIESTVNLDRYRALGPLDSDQEEYSMLDRKPEQKLLPYCEENKLAFLAYSPLARGLLTGKLSPARPFPDGDHRKGRPRFSPENRRKVLEMVDQLRPIADKLNYSLVQLVIAWTVRQPGVTHALVGARNEKQAVENYVDVPLGQKELDEINAVLSRQVPAIA